jgi:hypothetical protein
MGVAHPTVVAADVGAIPLEVAAGAAYAIVFQEITFLCLKDYLLDAFR